MAIHIFILLSDRDSQKNGSSKTEAVIYNQFSKKMI